MSRTWPTKSRFGLPISKTSAGLLAGSGEKKNAQSFKKERFLAEKKNEKKNGMKKKNKKRTFFIKDFEQLWGF